MGWGGGGIVGGGGGKGWGLWQDKGGMLPWLLRAWACLDGTALLPLPPHPDYPPLPPAPLPLFMCHSLSSSL